MNDKEWMLDLAERLMHVPATYVDQGDCDRLREIASRKAEYRHVHVSNAMLHELAVDADPGTDVVALWLNRMSEMGLELVTLSKTDCGYEMILVKR